jgi:hypothetical protein
MTIDEVIAKMYAAMSFERGARPDWDAQRDVFAPHARLVRIRDGQAFDFDPESFRRDYESMIESGALTSLFEHEISREERVIGNIGHVLSTYELRTARDGDLISRAIKSIQLFQNDGIWRISAMLWQRLAASTERQQVARSASLRSRVSET